MPTEAEIAAQADADAKTAADAKAKSDADAALGLGDAGKRALDAERLRASTAEKAASDAGKELIQLRKEKADAAAAKAAADEADAVQKGQFETLAATRKQEADEAKADAEAKGKKIERADAVLKSVVAARVKDLESLDDKDLTAAFPKDAEPLEQLEWLDDPRTKAAMRAAKETADAKTRRVSGGVTPRATGTAENATDAEKERLRGSGKYGI